MKLNEMLDQRRAVLLDYVYKKTEGVVQHGIFKGMKILKKHIWGDGDLGGKLLGIYEDELYPIIEKEVSNNHDVVVNYGCAEGYYGIGIAIKLPNTRVVMFDLNKDTLDIAKENAQLNGVTNVEFSSQCNDLEYLESILRDYKNPLIIMDCEGYEDLMLDPVSVPSLSRSTVIVEMHDCLYPNLTDRLVHKFNDIHDLEGITQGTKNLHIEPILEFSDTDKFIIANENRPRTMHWVYMVPKAEES